MEIVFILAFVVFAIVAAIVGSAMAKKRREELGALATRLGLRFDPEQDRQLPHRYAFLDKLAQGSNRYAYNVMAGAYQNNAVQVFDYHYETHSTDSKGRRRTHHHYLSCFILSLPRTFPELIIAEEGLFSKVAQFFGYDDIDFESAEFSKRFCVRSADKKFAYDICHTRMMEYLLGNADLNIEIDADSLAVVFPRPINPQEIERNLERLIAVRNLIPEYLWTT